jgi:hypothetical protein
MLYAKPETKEPRMSIVTVSRVTSGPSDAQHELSGELRHVRDLVFVRDLLRERGAAADELLECDAVIADARARLAESAKRSSARYAAAA